jgi:2-oxoglutarate ferredoxin oxidoreductase subunit alpha
MNLMADLKFDKEITFVIAGEAGQGIDSITQLIAETVNKSGYNVFYTKEYMSRIKGGHNSSTIRISSDKVEAYRQIADFVFTVSKEDLNHVKNRIADNTIVISEYDVPEELNKFKNTIISGIIIGILDIDLEILKEIFKKIFSIKTMKLLRKIFNHIKRLRNRQKTINEKQLSIIFKKILQ